MISKKVFSMMLSLIMILTMIPSSSFAMYSSSDFIVTKDSLNVGDIVELPLIEGAKVGGAHDDKVDFVVLSHKTNMGTDDGMLLISKNEITASKYVESESDQCRWQGSVLQKSCENFSHMLEEEIRSLCINTSVDNGKPSKISGDKAFCLSKKEFEDSREVIDDKCLKANSWWLRDSDVGINNFSFATPSLRLERVNYGNTTLGVRVALNVSNAVLFEREDNGVFCIADRNSVARIEFQDYDSKLIDLQYVVKNQTARDPRDKDDVLMPERRGYSFANWSGQLSKIGSDTILKAVYSENQYDINLYNNFNDNDEHKVTIRGVAYTEPVKLGKSKKVGYSFVSWNTKRDGSGQDYDEDSQYSRLVAENNGHIDLYAQYSEKSNYMVKFDSNGGTELQPLMYVNWNQKKLTREAKRRGYVFEGWFTEDGKAVTDDMTYSDISNSKESNAVTLYARWKPQISIVGACVTYAKSLNYNNGRVLKPKVKVTKNGEVLLQNRDYSVSYSSNKFPGKAGIAIRGIGDYKDKIDKVFVINQPKIAKISKFRVIKTTKNTVTFSWMKQAKATGYAIYQNGKLKSTVNKVGTVVTTIKKLKPGIKYYFQIKAFKKINGKKYYSNFSKKVYVTLLDKTTINAVKTKNNCVSVTWKNINCTKYEVQIAKNKSFTSGLKTMSVKSNHVTFKALKKGQIYYVRVRGVLKASPGTKDGSWSQVKKVECA